MWGSLRSPNYTASGATHPQVDPEHALKGVAPAHPTNSKDNWRNSAGVAGRYALEKARKDRDYPHSGNWLPEEEATEQVLCKSLESKPRRSI